MFTLNLKKIIPVGVALTGLITLSQIASAQQLEFVHNQSVKKSPHQQSISPSFSARKSGGSKITAHCWTIAECNEMISDCISVGGHFRHGITDHNTGATSEGSCTL